MKIKSIQLTLIIISSTLLQAQNLDSVRQVVNYMNFETPVLSPIPASVNGIEVAAVSLNGTWKFNPDNKDLNKPKILKSQENGRCRDLRSQKVIPLPTGKDFNCPQIGRQPDKNTF